MKNILEKLFNTPSDMTKSELAYLIENINDTELQDIISFADKQRQKYFQKRVYMRALIEFSSFCAQNCLYCGIRAQNRNAERYRLSLQQVLECCELAYSLDYRTFVLQSGEDFTYSADDICHMVCTIKNKFPDCAITLSIGEKTYEEYLAYYQAGADRYLLRHEAASRRLYEYIHPPQMSYDNRRQCLYNLKEIGYQTGAGFMVGLPTQTAEDLAEDILFIRDLQPHMVGIGPFIHHKDTPFKDEESGSLRQTLLMIALTRITLPQVLLPATTALGSLDIVGREKGLAAGANVVMPNVSPKDVRAKYLLYDGKICTGDEAAECRMCMAGKMTMWGFTPDLQRGDHPIKIPPNLSFENQHEFI